MAKTKDLELVKRDMQNMTSLIQTGDEDIIIMRHNMKSLMRKRTFISTSVYQFALPAVVALTGMNIVDTVAIDGLMQVAIPAVLGGGIASSAAKLPFDYKNNIIKYVAGVLGLKNIKEKLPAENLKGTKDFFASDRIELEKFNIDVASAVIDAVKEGYLIPNTLAVSARDTYTHQVTTYLVKDKGEKVIEQVIEPTALYMWDQMADAVLDMDNFPVSSIIYLTEMDEIAVGKLVCKVNFANDFSVEDEAYVSKLREEHAEKYKEHVESLNRKDRYGYWHNEDRYRYGGKKGQSSITLDEYENEMMKAIEMKEQLHKKMRFAS